MIAAMYIEKFEDLMDTPQTINFGGKYLYAFQKKDENTLIVTRAENEQYIQGFFNIDLAKKEDKANISLVSAIVGENGVGKTRLLGAFVDKKNIKNKVITIICEDENAMPYCMHSQYEILQVDDEGKLEKKNNNLKTLYYSSYFKNKAFGRDFDDSLLTDISFYTNYKTSIADQYYQLLLQQIEFSETNEFQNIVGPKMFNDKYKDKSYYLTLNMNFLLKDAINLHNYKKGNLNSILKIFEVSDNYDLSEIKIDDFNKSILLSIIKTFAINENIIIENNIDENSNYYDVFIKLMTLVNNSKIELLKDVYNKFYEKLDSWFEKSRNRIKIDITTLMVAFPHNIRVLSDVLIEIERGLEFYNLYKEFINKIIDLFKDNDSPRLSDEVDIMTKYGLFYLDSGYSLSGGESALINFYTLLYSHIKTIKNDKNILFLIDEGDLGFHPIWKKKYVKMLLETLPYFFPKDAKLQIIFTTHDPLTLSDMPNNNVVFLAKDKESNITKILENKDKPKRTFAANITDILANSFFVEDGLIGDFAKMKIEQTIKWINDQKKERSADFDEAIKQYSTIVRMIDEPVIRRKLMEMIAELMPAPINKKAILEAQLAEIQRQLKELDNN